MTNYLFKDAGIVKAQIQLLLAHNPELEEDVELLTDTLEGETDLHKILDKAITLRSEAETMAAAIKLRETALTERRKRYEAQSSNIKALMLQLMEIAGVDKIILPEASLSVTNGRESVNITNVDDLPQGYYKTERVADKKAIMACIKEGTVPPGAELVMGTTGLTIRTR